MERARVNGVELEYELKGSGEPVLLIHGSHIARSFLPLLSQPSLTERYTLIRYHRRGFLGSSPARGPVSIEDQATDARALLAYLHMSPAHIVGHSYGGSIALQLAVDATTHVHSLVLLEAALTTVPHWKAVRELNVATTERYRQGDWEAAVDAFLGAPAERSAVIRNVPGGLEQAMRDLDTYFSIEVPAHEAWHFSQAQGKQITQPVLFIQAGEGQVLYRECRDQIQQWMPQTEVVVLPGATHLLHMQQPAGAAAVMGDFFQRHAIAPPAPAQSAQRWQTVPYNATTDLLDGNLEHGRSHKVAIRTPTGDWTYAEVAAAANRAGNALRELGVEMENRMHDVRPDCSGTVVEGYEARIIDEQGREVPSGQPGMLLIKGESICASYWRQHELAKETMLGAWFKTGDIYTRDASGHFYYQGRSDDMLKVGGMWVSPHEVEEALKEDDSVVECAVVGVPDNDALVKPEAFVVLANTGSGQEVESRLRQHVRQRLGGNKTPRAFHFVEALPKTATGQVYRLKLRELIQPKGAPFSG